MTGAQGGSSYELPYLGRMAFENSVANPGSGSRTVVAEQDDTSPTSDTDVNGQVYVYAGDKKSSGSPVERAGLSGGSLYGIKVLVNGSSGHGVLEEGLGRRRHVPVRRDRRQRRPQERQRRLERRGITDR